MHSLVSFIQTVSAPMVSAINMLAPALAEAGDQSYVRGEYTAAAFALTAGIIALFCVLWACWLHGRLRTTRATARDDRAMSAADIAFRDALLNNGMQGMVVLRNELEDREYWNQGKLLLDVCFDSLDAPKLIKALDQLSEHGTAFAMQIRAAAGTIAVTGVPVGSRAAVYLYEQDFSAERQKYLDVLDSIPVPVWTRDDRLALDWANQAYLSMVGADKLADAQAANLCIDAGERELSMTVIESGKRLEAGSAVLLDGERRYMSFRMSPAGKGLISGIAIDETNATHAQAVLQRSLDAQTDLVEHLPVAVATFDAQTRLERYNTAYARLWGLTEAFLATRPALSEILSELREQRKLPEQRNFIEWKRDQVEGIAERKSDQTWHLPGGRSVRIVSYPHLQGGVFVICEDISERLRLEASLGLLTQVQKATLDTLDEAVGIFGTDGRLVLHNGMFSHMWQLTDHELATQPHFAEIAELCATRIGRDGIWGIVSCGINSPSPERFGHWGKARRADGRVISLSLSRLPNGATIATFADLTDLENFGSALRDERPGAMASGSISSVA